MIDAVSPTLYIPLWRKKYHQIASYSLDHGYVIYESLFNRPFLVRKSLWVPESRRQIINQM